MPGTGVGATIATPRSASPGRVLATALAAVAAAAAIIVGLMATFPPLVGIVLVPGQLSHVGGSAYLVSLPPVGTAAYQALPDVPAHPVRSSLRLFEDERELGPAHAVHADIATQGRGAFSHWNGVLYFAASDNADPRTNGRRYRAEIPLQLQAPWAWSGLAAAGLALVLLAALQRRRMVALAARVRSKALVRCAGGVWPSSLVLGAVVGFGVAVAVLGAAALAPRHAIDLDARRMQPEQGLAFVVALPGATGWLYRLCADSQASPNGSTLELSENGRLLGPPHAAHDSVRGRGGGRFSHWGGHLFFSTSDNSDPRRNGRTYGVRYELSLNWYWHFVGWAGLVLGVACASRTGIGRLAWRRGTQLGDAVLRSRTWLLLASLASAAAVAVAWFAGSGTPDGTEVLRLFPVSDASGYHSCATSLAAKGSVAYFHLDWCTRRIVYVGFLAALLPAVSWSSQVALLVQGALIGLSIALLVRHLMRSVGALGGIVVAALLAAFAWQVAIGVFMTEALGIPLGLAALAVLLAASHKANLRWMLAGTALLSGALTARAGPMLVLPALVAWIVIVAGGTQWRTRARAAVAAVGAAASGPLLQVLAVALLGHSVGNSGGNYAASLYALSIGSHDWTDAYRDFGALFAQGEGAAFRHLYGVALSNIAADPALFVRTLGHASDTYFSSLFGFLPAGSPAWLPPLCSVLAALGLLRTSLSLRRPWATLLLLLAAGEMASAPLIIDSGGVRVFAASIAVRCVLVGVAVHWLLAWVMALGAAAQSARTAEADGLNVRAAMALGFALLLGPLLVATPLRHLARLPTVHPQGCPPGQSPVAARIGGESVALTLSGRATGVERLFPFAAGERRLTAGSDIVHAALGADMAAAPRPVTLVRAVDRAPGATPLIRPLAITTPVPDDARVLTLCVDPRASPVMIANVPFERVQSILSPAQD